MTDPILMFMTVNAVALLLLGTMGVVMPRSAVGFASTGLSGLGALLCLPPLLMQAAVSTLTVPVGPPGLSLHLTLGPISICFLLIIFSCGTVVAAFASAASTIVTPRATLAIPLCMAGLALVLLAADAVTLAIGLSLTAVALWRLDTERTQSGDVAPMVGIWTAPLLLLIALCLLAPAGFAPRFDAIRAVPIDVGRATVAAALALAASLSLLHRQPARLDSAPGHWARATLTAGAVIPCATYLLIRLVLDLPGSAAQAWWGFVLLLTGSVTAVAYGWRAARHRDLSGSVGCLVHRQMGLAMIGLGLTEIARCSDLPDAAAFGLAAIVLLTIASGAAGTLAILAAHALEHGAATVRLARLGGLIQSMPVASLALASALVSLSALPSAAGFASLWLLLQAILSAPRTGGLISQLPLALVAAALALSSALATAAVLRLIGIVVLSRPRSVRGSVADDVATDLRPILLILSAVSLLIGVLPGPALRLLADPMIGALTGAGLGPRAGWTILSASTTSNSYAPLPILLLLVLVVGAVRLLVRRFRRQTRIAAVWSDGVAPSPTLPFGDPVAQSVGAGFLPVLPDFGLRRLTLPRLPPLRWSVSRIANAIAGGMADRSLGLWTILLAFGLLLLVLSLFDPGSQQGWPGGWPKAWPGG